jgi:hypothetical protein
MEVDAASPGPWWGCNGVRVLALTEGLLWEVKHRLVRDVR